MVRTVRLLALLAVLGGCSPAEDATRPNIVLIIADDQDYRHFGFLGHPQAHTPNLDTLAHAGLRFRAAHVPVSRCRPTLAGLLSGRWPHQNGVFANVGPAPLDPRDSLPRLLEAAGYATFGGGKFWEGAPDEFGFDRHSFGDLGDPDTLWEFVRDDRQRELFAFIDEHAGDQPLFVWWAPMLPHLPHTPPKRFEESVDANALAIPDHYTGDAAEYRRRESRSLAMVGWMDAEIGRLMTKLREAGLYEHTLFVFLIDNGWSNGLVSKGSPFEQGLQTPLVFAWEGVTDGSEVRAGPVSTVDVLPTILDYAGLPVPPTAAGRSLRAPRNDGADVVCGAQYPAKVEPDATPEGSVYALHARDERWKYVLYLGDVRAEDNEVKASSVEPGTRLGIVARLARPLVRRRGDEDLFDLAADPHELHDLSAEPEHAARKEELRAAALRWWSATGGGALDLP